MRTIETTVYLYDELGEKAKARARDWYREGDTFDPDYEFAETAAKLLGVTFAQIRTTRDTSKRGPFEYQSDIRWTGFDSQGDGLSFAGTYRYVPGAAAAVRAEFPNDRCGGNVSPLGTRLYHLKHQG